MNIVSLILVIALNALFLCEAYINWVTLVIPLNALFLCEAYIECLVYFIFLFLYGSQVLLEHIFYFWSYSCLLHVQSDRLDLFRHTLEELFLSVQWKRARWSDCCHCQWISNGLLWIKLLISTCRLIVKCPCHHFMINTKLYNEYS